MRCTVNILLFSKNQNWCLANAGLLRISGYNVEIRDDALQAINLYRIRQTSVEPISLLIAEYNTNTALLLNSAFQAGIVGRLLFAQSHYNCEELYCLDGPTGMLCHSPSLLASVVTLLRAQPHALYETNMNPASSDRFDWTTPENLNGSNRLRL